MFDFDTVGVRFRYFHGLNLIQIDCGILRLNSANVFFIVLIDLEVYDVISDNLKLLEVMIYI
jgi:hypothetical protein